MQEYKFSGINKNGEFVDLLIIEGTSAEPVRWINKGENAFMTKEEVKFFSDMGYSINEVKSEDTSANSDGENKRVQKEKEAGDAAKQGSSNTVDVGERKGGK